MWSCLYDRNVYVYVFVYVKLIVYEHVYVYTYMYRYVYIYICIDVSIVHVCTPEVPLQWSELSKVFDTRISQDGLTGSAWGDWANYTASPLRWVTWRGKQGGKAGEAEAPMDWIPSLSKHH